tara:strand:- start:92243 stop:93034 length:792 start_codon:yes stop_codon:yes gene_type:complete
MTDESVLVGRRGAVLWITLNRPNELNAMDRDLLTALEKALDEAEGDRGVICIVLTGAGRAFCAGADLKFVKDFPEDEREAATAAFLYRATTLMARLEAFPKPVIAAVNGIATAGGMELLLCCDLVIASDTAKLGDGHANFGLLPGAGASYRLPRKIGLARAKYLFFTGVLLSAEELRDAGLVNKVVPHSDLVEEVDVLTELITSKSPLGLRRMKELANASFDLTQEQALRAEQAACESYVNSYDRNEGLAAFNERRRPSFRGC